jgi:hypothetical protein
MYSDGHSERLAAWSVWGSVAKLLADGVGVCVVVTTVRL